MKEKPGPNLPVDSSFHPRSKKRFARCRNKVNSHNHKDIEPIFNRIQNYMTNGIKNAFYHMRIFSQ